MDNDKIEILRGDASDPYSFSGDGNEDGDVVTQHRFYQWGDDCVIAIGELNQRNQWDDEAFDAKCERLISALTTPAPDSEKLREALTPSGDTKAAYLGEFKFDVMFPSLDEDDDEPVPHPVTVPWDTIKEIMAAIASRAGASL